MNHQDIVQRVKDQSPPDTFASVENMLAFILRVIAALPPNERAGLLKGPSGGENIAFYGPAGVHVRVNRICYPDGSFYKVLTDSGPGGSNGAAWNGEDELLPDNYVPVVGGVPNPETPPHEDDPPDEDNPLLLVLQEVQRVGTFVSVGFAQLHHEQQQQLALLEEINRKLDNRPDIDVQFPEYTGSFGTGRFAMPVRLTPKR